MTTESRSVVEVKAVQQWWRALRPLVWWLIVVFFLFLWRTHTRLSEITSLEFAIVLGGQNVATEASATLDGKPFQVGARVPIGGHTLVIRHPKAEEVSTNFIVWYGKNDIGRFLLSRSKGTLSINASPPARLLLIQGAEFSKTLTNTPGGEFFVPTDTYMIQAKYLTWEKSEEIAVSSDAHRKVSFAPPVGSLEIHCTNTDASFELLSEAGTLIDRGRLPTEIHDLTEGVYHVNAHHLGNTKEEVVRIARAQTNAVRFDFRYGAAFVETVPAGATVFSGRRELGTTPVLLDQLEVGSSELTLHRDGYEPLSIFVQIVAHQTNSIHTNLVNATYSSAMAIARDRFSVGEFASAVEAAARALRIQPDDLEAKTLKGRAFYAENIRLARELAGAKRYSEAVQRVTIAMGTQPTNEEARTLLEQYQKASDDSRRDRVIKIAEAFESLLQKLPEAALFDLYELRTSKPASDVEKEILRTLKTRPRWQVKSYSTTIPHEFALETGFDFTASDNGTAGGRRRFLMLGADIADRETLILFKDLEYRPSGFGALVVQGLLTPASTTPSKYTPISKSAASGNPKLQAELNEGLAVASEFLETVVGKDSIIETVHKRDAPKAAASEKPDSP